MSRGMSGWRLALAYVPLLVGLVTLALTLPAMALLGWGALYMLVSGFALVAAGLIALLWLAARARARR